MILIMGIILVGLGMYSIYITSPIKIDLEKEIKDVDLIDFRNFIISKGKDWLLKNKELIREIMIKKYGLEQGQYNYIFLLKTFAFGIDRKIKESKW